MTGRGGVVEWLLNGCVLKGFGGRYSVGGVSRRN